MVNLWGRQWSRSELLARVGRLEQLAGVAFRGRNEELAAGAVT